jgi:hypothetical protein
LPVLFLELINAATARDSAAALFGKDADTARRIRKVGSLAGFTLDFEGSLVALDNAG